MRGLMSLPGNSSFASGAIMLLLVQTFSGWLKSIVEGLLFLIARTFSISITISDEDDSYRWVMQYLAEMNLQGRLTAANLTLAVDAVRKKTRSWGRRGGDSKEETARDERELLYLPGIGVHVLHYSFFRYVLLYRQGDGSSNQLVTMTTFNLPFVSPGIEFFNKFVRESRKHVFAKDESRTNIYVIDKSISRSGWSCVAHKNRRSWDSVILDGSLAEDLHTDASKFLRSGAWYRDIGIPFRRSFLLAGPPGTGKTSTVAALCGRLDLDIAVLSLSDPALTDMTLASILRGVPSGCAVLLEDIDAAFPKRDLNNEFSAAVLPVQQHESQVGRGDKRRGGPAEELKVVNSLTLSGLLNAIDGLMAQEGLIFFFTTNHIEALDDALLRPGRCDRIVEIKLASTPQIETLFLRFFKEEHQLAKLFSKSVPEYTVSMAALQGHLVLHRDDAMQACKTVHVLVDKTKSVGPESSKNLSVSQ